MLLALVVDAAKNGNAINTATQEFGVHLASRIAICHPAHVGGATGLSAP